MWIPMEEIGGNMKLLRVFIILLVLCLAGCTIGEEPQETTSPFDQTAVPTTHTPMQTEITQPQETIQPEPAEEDFVKVSTYIPDVLVDLRYSTADNFTGRIIYDFNEVWLRYGTVKKLMLVQEELKKSDLCLKIWDGFRPPTAQFKLWDICPDPTYVSDPNKGFSSHSRGNTVDITLVQVDGTELTMPTGFDDFSKLADRDYSDCSQEAASNARFLEQIMTKYGFKPYSGEWWHFTDTRSYPVEQEFKPVASALYYADCNEFISLRTDPSTAGEMITKISAGEQFCVVAHSGDFALIEYRELTGYVLRSYIRPMQ